MGVYHGKIRTLGIHLDRAKAAHRTAAAAGKERREGDQRAACSVHVNCHPCSVCKFSALRRKGSPRLAEATRHPCSSERRDSRHSERGPATRRIVDHTGAFRLAPSCNRSLSREAPLDAPIGRAALNRRERRDATCDERRHERDPADARGRARQQTHT